MTFANYIGLVTESICTLLGHTFSLSRLAAALGQLTTHILDHLANALQLGFINAHPTEDHYQFEHPIIREVIYTEMLSGLRKRYHHRAARVLEQEGQPGLLDAKIDALAHHYLRAGQHEQALAYLARAVKRARTLHAFESALNYLDQALAVVDCLSRTATDAEEQAQRDKQRADLLAARTQIEALIAD